jgi:hypothetical protein
MTGTADRLREGRDLLQRGAWAEARKAFAAALAESGDPATAEKLARAAWWLDEDAEVTARYEDAYRGYRAAGDDRGAARVAAWLGNGALQLRGEAAVAQGWFQRAGRPRASSSATRCWSGANGAPSLFVPASLISLSGAGRGRVLG